MLRLLLKIQILSEISDFYLKIVLFNIDVLVQYYAFTQTPFISRRRCHKVNFNNQLVPIQSLFSPGQVAFTRLKNSVC